MQGPGLFIFICFLMVASTGKSQNLDDHRWNDRLVIIVVDHHSNQLYQNQLVELIANREGLEERRIVIYQVLPGRFLKGMEKETTWKDSAKLYQRLNPSRSEFEVILLGLDGGIKLRSEVPIKCEDLFGVIDQMPMRRAEMNRIENNQ